MLVVRHFNVPYIHAMAKYKTLEQWQIDDAERLRSLFKDRVTITQEEFGIQNQIGTQSMVWQYLKGHRPLNMSAAAAFAAGIGCDIDDFSPTIAQQIRDAAKAVKADFKWPFQAVDENKVSALTPHETIQLEAAILIAAAQVGIDIRR